MAASKKALMTKLPPETNRTRTRQFQELLDNRMLDIMDEESIDTYRDMLLYMPESPDGSHVDLHMPDKTSDGKATAQINALNKMLDKSKTANSCFSDAMTGYQSIAAAISDRIPEIVAWMQNENNTRPHTIVMNKEDVDQFISLDESNDSNALGYGYRKDSRGHIDPFEASTMTIVLHKNETSPEEPLGFNGMGFHVYTAYPGQRMEQGDDIKGIIPLQEDALKTAVKTEHYRKATETEKAIIRMTTSSNIRFPMKTNIYYDQNKNAAVLCVGESIDQRSETITQQRHFIKSRPGSEETSVRSKLYTKPLYDSEAKYSYYKDLSESECVRTDKLIKSCQTCFEKQLKLIKKNQNKRLADAAEMAAQHAVEDNINIHPYF